MSNFIGLCDGKLYTSHDTDSRAPLKKKYTLSQQEKTLALDKLKELIKSSLNFAFKDKSCCFDDNFLNRFLYKCKFIPSNAFKLLTNYFDYKSRNSSILKKLSVFDERVQKSLVKGNPTVLRQRDRKGHKIITFTASNWDENECSLIDIYRTFLLTLDLLLENVQNQALGFVIIVDWSGFSFKQSKYLSPSVLHLIVEGLQNSVPAKFKGVHFVSQPWYVEMIFSLIKSTLDEKSKNRLYFHGSNLAALHNFVNKALLPTELGGAGPSVNNLDWYHFALEASQNLPSLQTYKLMETPNYNTIT